MTAIALARRWRRLDRVLLLPLLGAMLATAALLAVGLGAVAIPPDQALAALLGREVDERVAGIVLQLRLPRAVLAICAGAALGVAGAALQGLLRNPLADPVLIGVSGGAALGAVAAIVVGHKLATLLPPEALRWLVPAAAFAGALAAVTGVMRLGGAREGSGPGALILAGIAISALASAGIGAFIFMADDRQLRDFIFWNMGSVAGASWQGLAVAAPLIALATGAMLAAARPLDAILLGEREAGHLGFDVPAVRRRVIAAVALAVGAGVAFTGMIAFVGLIVPHLVRLVAGAGHRLLLPASALLGAALLLLADCAARTVVAPAELPIGLVTSALGTPFFMALIVRRRSALG